jgi:hypothetical protein
MSQSAAGFTEFLARIAQSDTLVRDLQDAHQSFRAALRADPDIAPVLVNTFLQGSYRRNTAIKPAQDSRADVDVVAVTIWPAGSTPVDTLRPFVAFLERNYKGRWEAQTRSFRVRFSNVDLDVVVAIPSIAMTLMEATREYGRLAKDDRPIEKKWDRGTGATAWEPHPLLIPDREQRTWVATHPLLQIEMAVAKNDATNGHFKPAFKALKWWRRTRVTTKYPKGYPWERLIHESMPDGVTSVAEALTGALEGFVSRFAEDVRLGRVPNLPDFGVSQNVLSRIASSDFQRLYATVHEAALTARLALDEPDGDNARVRWMSLFGSEFPAPEGGFSKRTAASTLPAASFA